MPLAKLGGVAGSSIDYDLLTREQPSVISSTDFKKKSVHAKRPTIMRASLDFKNAELSDANTTLSPNSYLHGESNSFKFKSHQSTVKDAVRNKIGELKLKLTGLQSKLEPISPKARTTVRSVVAPHAHNL
eukprot:CAMPEP_0170486890 /NCGR_PEP_ID=MMETSP0208-20121228/5810_1 /TAXON_ID=197538 /ORGANISM="Strombidium inclinatum, Strain S3" /LENGTH=129 /DNA_ID=CAMNT_0010760977 /DNA_START=275 /DNA_END=664 /DNA_ORIENTATION=-